MLQYININNQRGGYFVSQYRYYEQMGRPFPNISDFYKSYSTRKFAADLNCRQHCDNLYNTVGFSYVGGAIWGNTFNFSYCTCWRYAGEYFYICECAQNDYLICSPELAGMLEKIHYSYFFGNKYTIQKKERNSIIDNYTIAMIDKTGRSIRRCVLGDNATTILQSGAYLANWEQYHKGYNVAMLENALARFSMNSCDIPIEDYARVRDCTSYTALIDTINDIIHNVEMSTELHLENERSEWSQYLDAVL